MPKTKVFTYMMLCLGDHVNSNLFLSSELTPGGQNEALPGFPLSPYGTTNRERESREFVPKFGGFSIAAEACSCQVKQGQSPLPLTSGAPLF